MYAILQSQSQFALPSSVKNVNPYSPPTPIVSTAIGMKTCVRLQPLRQSVSESSDIMALYKSTLLTYLLTYFLRISGA